MPLRDKNIEWLRRHDFIPVRAFTGLAKVDANGAAAAWALGEMLTDAAATRGAGAALTSKILKPNLNSLRIQSVQFDTAADDISHQFLLPFDMDPAFSMKFAIWYTSTLATSGATKTFTWRILFNDPGQAAIAVVPATVLDTAIVAHAWGGVAYAQQRTAFGVINANKWTRAQIEGGRLINLLIDINAVGAGVTLSADLAHLLGLEISYVPQRTRGSGNVRDVDAA